MSVGIIPTDSGQDHLGLVAMPAPGQAYRPQADGLADPRIGCGGGESVGQVKVEQRHREPRRLQEQLRVGGEI